MHTRAGGRVTPAGNAVGAGVILASLSVALVAAFSEAGHTPSAARAEGPTGARLVRETSLGPTGNHLAVSPDRRHVARVVRRGPRETVLLDRTEHRAYDAVNGIGSIGGFGVLAFSPDSQRLAYLGRREGAWRLLLNGEEVAQAKVGGFLSNKTLALIFSPDSSRWFAWEVDIPGARRFLFEGQPNPDASPGERTLDWADPESFCVSQDGRRFVGIRDEGKPGLRAPDFASVLVVYGAQGEEPYPRHVVSWWRALNSFRCRLGYGLCEFSPDGRRLTHATILDRRGSSCGIVVNGVLIGEGEELGWPAFSADSNRFAYPIKRSGKWHVVVDGHEEGVYDDIGRDWPLVFTSDSKRLAYRAKTASNWFMVIDGKAGEAFDELGRPVFDLDSQRVAYRAKRGKKWFVVVDGAPGSAYDSVEDKAVTDISVNGWFREELMFSPDGKRLAYRVQKAGKRFVVVDGQEGPAFSEVAPPAFSPDGKHMAYVAKREGQWQLVVDGVDAGAYDFLTDRSVVFDGPNRLHAVIRKGDEYLLLEVEIPQS